MSACLVVKKSTKNSGHKNWFMKTQRRVKISFLKKSRLVTFIHLLPGISKNKLSHMVMMMGVVHRQKPKKTKKRFLRGVSRAKILKIYKKRN